MKPSPTTLRRSTSIAVLAVAILCIGSLAVCANSGHAVAVNPVKKKTPYQMCADHYRILEKKGGIYYGQWVQNLFVLRNHNIQPKEFTNAGQPILPAAQYHKLERTCHIP